MDSFFYAYLIAWLAACLLAGVVFLRSPGEHVFTRREYWRFLFAPWRATTFAIAATAMVLVGPYTVDPTWDWVDAGFMSALAYTTAPATLGTLHLALRGRASWRRAYVAAALWMFSVSWSYDAYILWRDGSYPLTWLPNIGASSVLYACAGLFWSLDWRRGRGVTFAFLEADWPSSAAPAPFLRIVGYALPLMLLVAGSVVYFLA